MLRGDAAAVICVISIFACAAAAQVSGNSSPADLDRFIADAQKQPGNATLCERVGVAYARREDFSNAAEWFEKTLSIEPDRLSARKNLATVLWFSGRRDKAEKIFKDVLNRVPADPVPHLYLGLTAYSRGQFVLASDHFEAAGLLASANPEVRATAADSYLQAGKYSEATRLLEGMIAAGARTASSYTMLAEAYDRQNRPHQAYAAYKKAVDLDTSDESVLAFARFALSHGNTAYARELLTRGISSNPSSAKLPFEIGVAWALDGNFDEALQRFAEAERKSPRWPVPVLGEGIALLQQGKLEEAAGSFRRAADVAPQEGRAHLLLTMALLRGGAKDDAAKRREATAAVRRAIQLEPNSGRAHALLAEIYQATDEQEAAVRELEAASRLEPGNAATLYKLSQAYRSQGKAGDAHRALLAFEQAKAKTKVEENELIQILKKVQ
jgi:tetratricopeptide (TPR) repeat protein